MYYINKNNFYNFLDRLREQYEVFVPVKKEETRAYEKYTGENENIVLGEVRPFEPLKAFFTRSREVIAEDFEDKVPHSQDKPYCIVGVKNCDLNSLNVQDHVFKNHDFKDPFYIINREENLIIASDCTCAIETCFCTAIGNQPYPEGNFDIAISELENVYLVDTGTDKGKELIEENIKLFEEAGEELIEKRDQQRKKVVDEVKNNIKEHDVPQEDSLTKDIVSRNFESEIWEDEAQTCVECGACTIICPSCHCFYLYDEKSEDKMERLRIWDSCMLKNYARVAGGVNPREKLWMRLRNRFVKKFDFFPKVADIYGCTGCGRCISACPAKIDIREVLRRLVDNE